MNKTILRLLILSLFLCCFATTMEAQRKQKQKGHKEIKNASQFSPIPKKSNPDTQGINVGQPIMFARMHRSNFNGKTGIDVSHYQGSVNWAQVAKDQQVTFVILKATEGRDFVDVTYARNIREARRQGIKVGSYHFYRANVDPDLQFQNMMRIINPKEQDLIPVIDVELTNGVSPELFVNRLESLCEKVHQAYGVRPMIYTGKNFFAKYFNNQRFSHYKFWIAAYTASEPQLAGDRDYIMWQFTDKSQIMGISGGVDMSRFMNGHTIDDILYRRK